MQGSWVTVNPKQDNEAAQAMKELCVALQDRERRLKDAEDVGIVDAWVQMRKNALGKGGEVAQ